MSLENEIKVLKENNNELVQKVQFWKMTAAQRENENVELMKEITDLRLKLSRLKNAGNDEAHKLDAAVQKSSEEVLSHLVQASNAVARSMDFVKTYMHKRQELEATLPRWSTISEDHSTKKIHKVRPMVAGRSVQQPFVLLDRSVVRRNQTNDRNEDQNHNVAERAIPMHMLLDVYIPLRRIDAEGTQATSDTNEDEEQDPNDSAENLGLEGGEERVPDEFENVTTDDAFEETRGLQAVSEESEEEAEQTPQRPQTDDPLEGPSWLLDRPNPMVTTRRNLEPDSTTGTEYNNHSPGVEQMINKIRRNSQVMRDAAGDCVRAAYASPGGANVFSPTVRRRRATPPPPATPASPHPARRSSNISGRVLKVLVPKIHLEASPVSPLVSPTLPVRHKRRAHDAADSPLKRPNIMRFDAPSPNGATDSKVIVIQPEPGGSGTRRQSVRDGRPDDRSPDKRASRPASHSVRDGRPDEQPDKRAGVAGRDSRPADRTGRESRPEDRTGRESRPEDRDSRSVSQSVRDSDSESEMLADRRPRRQKKAVVYKEKPLNRKMRR
ncbi:uncharacterized protein LOC121731845 isoform X2 [Aricia agestis]|uniref:uncharacterized protein LOC121731845 isoform X2 n=1 Tax=Aricia agestis TaxID=91739 RepID=UPI001C2058E5|nr:uncharacterized protein LOC121731845 isoform X2 [Aricia agestis]